jgi:hypothetical protein
MKVFVFDLLAYGENLEHLKTGSELPYPLSKPHFKADMAVRTYAEHLDAWEEIDRLGYDGVGFNGRRRLQRASLLALRADEFAQSDGVGRGATDEESKAAHLRQSAAAA